MRVDKRALGNDEPTYIVTLVHGTWAREADWTQSNSALRVGLADALDGNVEFRKFSWSGKNSNKARLHASNLLRYELLDIMQRKPKAQHFIVSHSHGGNVVSYALQDSAIANKVVGHVAMATPFIQVSTRHMDGMIWFLWMLIPIIGAILSIPIFAMILGAILGLIESILQSVINVQFFHELFWIPMLLAFFAAGTFWLWLRDLVVSFFTKHQTNSIANFMPTDVVKTPVLCIRIKGDEAGAWLKTITTPFGGIHLFSKIVDRVLERLLWWSNTGVIMPWFVLIVLLYGLAVLLSTASLTASLLFLAILTPVGALVLSIMFYANPLGLGFGQVLDSMFLKFKIQTHPDNSIAYEVIELSPLIAAQSIGIWDAIRQFFNGRLIHSSIYIYQDAIDKIAEWIREKAE